jgi:hypothetical protein
LAQYKVSPAGAPPAEAQALAPALVKEGLKVDKADGSTLCEIWTVATAPKEGAVEQNATWGAPHGSLLGVVRVPARWSDRRGQTIRPGVYTMRLSFFPMNGDHQGVAPQRDFAILSPVAIDTDAAALPAFDPLMDMSRKASGSPHPLVLSLWKESSPAPLGVEPEGDTDQVLHLKIGDVPVAIIVVGKSDH